MKIRLGLIGITALIYASVTAAQQPAQQPAEQLTQQSAQTPQPATSTPKTAPPPTLTIEDLRTPPSPAYVLLGIAPTAIERPVTPRALGVSLVSALTDGNGQVPQNFALEVAPYWLTAHPELTYKEYDSAGLLQGLKQTFSLSVATKGADNTAGSDSPSLTSTADAVTDVTRFGIAGRASWTFGRRSAAAEEALSAYFTKVGTIAADLGAPRQGAALGETQTLNAKKDISALSKAVVDTAKQGRIVIDVAAAISGRFEGNEFGGRRHEKTAFWITPSYRINREFVPETVQNPATVDLIGVVRYINDRTVTDDGKGIDIGARVLWENNSFAISGEYIQRMNVSNESERTALVVEFKLTDDLFLTGTIGQDFDDPQKEGNLLALFGMNFNVGKKASLIRGGN
jgi:hypothetical protein